MSEVYIKEPNTSGKAVLRTTHGDLEIELWANETPKACRNFCQLILEGYYNGTIFHRVIKDFIIQGGDKTNTGEGSDSIYGAPYPDEVHPRLKFRYRGMMGVASAGKGTKTNGSQFFIVLDRSPSLDMKHTLFGKVVGQTLYNLVRINDVSVDKNDRPLEPPRILRAELTWDPFGDLEPRSIPAPPSSGVQPAIGQHRRAPVHNRRILSFAASDEEDEHERVASHAKKGGAHDLLDDPRLLKEQAAASAGSKQPASTVPSDHVPKQRSTVPAAATPDKAGSKAARGALPIQEQHGVAKAKWHASEDGNCSDSGDSDGIEDSDEGVAVERSQRRQQEILKLKQDIVGMSSGGDPSSVAEAKKKNTSALEEQRSRYVSRGHVKAVGRQGRRKETEEVQHKLLDFRARLQKAVTSTGSDNSSSGATKEMSEEKKGQVPEDGTFAAIWREGDEEADEDWLEGAGLKFHVSGDKAFKLASQREGKALEIFDPLAAKGNDELLAEDRKRRAKAMEPVRRKEPTQKKGKTDSKKHRS